MAVKESKNKLHPNNKHNVGYDFDVLCKSHPELEKYVHTNSHGTQTIEFSNAKAVKSLNTALLLTEYNITYWEFPDENLCPPIPGRVDYIHYLADLLENYGLGSNSTLLDIGTGASCIYPLLGHTSYGWKYLATDIDEDSLESAHAIIKKNGFEGKLLLEHQDDETHIFKGIIEETDKFAASMCNPPFYSSKHEAMGANARKLKGLGVKDKDRTRNFSGNANELWYKGGEKAFLHTYLYESSFFKQQCFWYTSLVSKKENVKSMYTSLQKLGATEIHTIAMGQGNKVSRIVAWTFLTKKEQIDWNTK